MNFEEAPAEVPEFTAVESGTLHYKSELVGRIDDLQRSIREAPLDVEMPRDAIFGLLHAAYQLVNARPDQDPVRAIERARSELQNCLGSIGLGVDDKEKLARWRRRERDVPATEA